MHNSSPNFHFPELTVAELATLAFVTAMIVFDAWYVSAHSGFIGDDLVSFMLLRQMALPDFLFLRMDMHVAPVRQFLSLVVYWIAPMRFGVAVSVLAALQACTVAYLYALLRKMDAGRNVSLVLVCCYASSQLIVYGMIFWAHGQHRLPFVLGSLAAIYHYLVWLDRRSLRDMALVVCGYLLALMSYEIAVLIPVYLLVFAALTRWDKLRSDPFRTTLPAFALLLMSLSWVGFLLYLNTNFNHAFDPSLRQTLVAMLEFARSLAGSVLGMPKGISALAAVLVAAIWCGLLVLTLSMARATWLAWIAGLAILGLTVLPVALSNRVTIFGNLLAHTFRYQYEYLFLLILFAGIASAFVRRDYEGWRPSKRGLQAIGVAVVLAYASCNLVGLSFEARRHVGELLRYQRAHDYMTNLQAGLDGIAEKSPVFRNTPFPDSVNGLHDFDQTREILPLFIPGVRFDSTHGIRYAVQPDGSVIREDVP